MDCDDVNAAGNKRQADRCRFPATLWRAIEGAGLAPPLVLRTAGLPATAHLHPQASFSTAQIFSIWKAIEVLAPDCGFSVRLLHESFRAGHQPAFIAVLHAASFRDAVERLLRLKSLASVESYCIQESEGLWTFERKWVYASEPEPPGCR